MQGNMFTDLCAPIVTPRVALPPQPHGYTRMPNPNGEHNEGGVDKGIEVKDAASK
jgi:hypothetical protein